MPTCSILINNYNNAPFLRACIDSALAQTRPADEVIVYDDGSTDGSRGIIASYGNRIRAVLAPHFSDDKRDNLTNTINQGFRHSRGDLIFYLDGDDAFLPGKLAAYEAVFVANPDVVLVQAPLRVIDREGAPAGEKHHEWAHNVEIGERVRRTRDLDYFYPTSALGMRASFMARFMPLRFERGSRLDPDITFCVNAILRGRVVTLNEPWTLYRWHGANMSRRFEQPFYRMRFDRELNRYYNELAATLGAPRLNLWRNTKFYRRSARQVVDFAGAKLPRKNRHAI